MHSRSDASVLQSMETVCRRITIKPQFSICTELLNAVPPVDSAPEVIDALTQSCRKHSVSFLPMVSRAYHDSLFIARIAPVAMLFIPCRHGYSHRPDEFASPEYIARGALVLAQTLATLSA